MSTIFCCSLTNDSWKKTFFTFCEINATKFGSKIKFYTLLYITMWLFMAILLWLYLIHVWFDFILIVSCSWRNHIILLLMFSAEKVLLLLVLSLTTKYTRRGFVKPRSHCADLEVPISTTWKIVENGMVGSWSRGNIVLTAWKSARSGNDRQWSGSQYDSVKLCRVDRDRGYDLIMYQSCVESETSWDCRIQREGFRGQRMEVREDRVNKTIASCLIRVTFTFSYISRYEYISMYICLSFNNMSLLMRWGGQYVNRVNEKVPQLQLWKMGVRIKVVFERNS